MLAGPPLLGQACIRRPVRLAKTDRFAEHHNSIQASLVQGARSCPPQVQGVLASWQEHLAALSSCGAASSKATLTQLGDLLQQQHQVWTPARPLLQQFLGLLDATHASPDPETICTAEHCTSHM